MVYAYNSLDLVLGVVGGLSAVVASAMELLFGGFEEFRK